LHPNAKILSIEQMDDWVAARKTEGRKIGFTCGSFDLLHAGHVQYLAAARGLCDFLIVAVNSDESVARYKDPLRPINPQDQRMYVVAGLDAVDVVTLMEDDRPLPLLLRWKPALYIKGGGYTSDSLRSAEAVREYGGSVRVIEPEFGTSSSGLIERVGLLAAHAKPEILTGKTFNGLVLLDRDGTLIRDVPFLHDPDLVELLPRVPEGLVRLQEAGLRLAIVTNQQGIGLGYYTVQDFIAVNRKLFRELSGHGIRIARVYFCPHSLDEQCSCRKPGSSMITRAMRDFDMPSERTFVIGDSEADMQAGQAAGCRTVLTGTAGFLEAAEAVLRYPR